MVPINLQPAARTSVDSVGQRHLLPMSTGATVLTCVGWVDSHNLPSASVYCFVLDELCELRPGCVRNRLSETMVMQHPVDFKVLDTDCPEAIDDFPALLVGKVTPSVGDPFVDLRDNLAGLLPLRSHILSLGKLSLLPGQVFFVFPKELGNRNGLRGRKSGEGDEAHINANSFRGRWQGSNFHLAGKANKPLAGRASLDRASLGSSLDRSVKDNPDLPNLGELQGVPFKLPSEPRLRIGEGVVAVKATEAGIAGSLSCLDPAKEGLESQVNPDSRVLEDLGIDGLKRRTFCFEQGEGLLLAVEGETFVPFLPGCLSLLQEMVVEPAALVKSALKLGSLFFGWLDPVFERFTHELDYSVSLTKNQACCAIHPPAKAGGLLARFM